MSIVLWFLATFALLVFLYWLIVVGEGTYLGRTAVRFIYQRGARFYDAVRLAVIATDEAVFLPLFHEALEGLETPQVLDVATGTGRVPLLLAPQPWFKGEIWGIDFAPAMLERARAKAAAAPVNIRTNWIQGDSEALPWANGRFDLVTSLEALEFFVHPRRALVEMGRVLKPGGTLIVSKYPDRWARVLPGKGLTDRQMTELLQRHGFWKISVQPWQPGHYELVIGHKLKEPDIAASGSLSKRTERVST